VLVLGCVAGCGAPEAPADAASSVDAGRDSSTDGGRDAGPDAWTSRCGDGFVDPASEFCDDANDVPDDGCDHCMRTCAADATCDDGQICDGDESCVAGLCSRAAPAPDGTTCLHTGKGGACVSGVCVPNV
jgi:cysteine-rich repeat protein